MSTDAASVPSWRENLTIPNAITGVRLVLIVAFGVLLARGDDAWAITVLAVAGVSDFLDGYLARRLKQSSPWGRVLDPAADRLLTVVVVVGLAWRGIIPWWLVAVLLVRDVVVGIALWWLARKGGQAPAVTFTGKSATFGLYVFLPLAYLAHDRWPAVIVVALVGASLSAILYWASAVQYLTRIRRAGAAAAASA